MNLVRTPKKDVDIFKENAKLRGALVEMLTNHGHTSFFEAMIYGSTVCECHACTNARKLLAGE